MGCEVLTNLHKAKIAKNDEFYTQLSDIEIELSHYKEHLKGKIIYCNCDNPKYSAFWQYFHIHFAEFGLKKLIATYYAKGERTYKTEYEGGNDEDISKGTKTELSCDGDFRSPPCLDLLAESDIAITNPPFSLFREYIAMVMQHNKKFLVIGNKNSVNYNDFFHYLKANKLWFGFSSPSEFNTSAGVTKKLQGLCRWFTNLDISKRHTDLVLHKKYVPVEYPTYDNYNAINVDKVTDIPCDYNGVMGVPITFFDKYNPEQFEILGRSGDIAWAETECDFFTPPPIEKQEQYKKYYKNWRVQNSYLLDKKGMPVCIYYRLFIRKRKQ